MKESGTAVSILPDRQKIAITPEFPGIIAISVLSLLYYFLFTVHNSIRIFQKSGTAEMTVHTIILQTQRTPIKYLQLQMIWM